MSHRLLCGPGGRLALTFLALFSVSCVVNNGGAGGAGGGGSGGASSTATNEADKVGVACAPPDERNPRFSGFQINENVLIQGAPECGSGVCLVNHFQGEVACPLGQAAPLDAQGLEGCIPERDVQGNVLSAQGTCSAGALCVQAGSRSPSCDPSKGDDANKLCAALGAGGKCGASGVCECSTDADCTFVADQIVSCDAQTHQCVPYACHVPGSCQVAGASAAENAGKACCVPETDTPVTVSVCGQCTGHDGQHTRDAEDAVYCTCRCGVADGAPEDPDYPFCACPDGFECSQIRDNVGLGDERMTGKYCIKAGTAYDPSQDQCGLVDGHWDVTCRGAASGL